MHEYGGRLKSWKMLDIGVGGGRTTRYFADLAGEYVGIDYSPGMIAAARERFDRRFEVCDVRDLGMFADAYFDFAMFSFNGLDMLSHEDRQKALQEIRRVLKDDGVFFFSTHNLNSIDRLYYFRLSRQPIDWLRSGKYLLFRLKDKNRSVKLLKTLPHCTIKRAYACYFITPGAQVRQLEDAGFKNVRALSRKDGFEIKGRFDRADDPWLYFLCEKRGGWRPYMVGEPNASTA